MNASRLVRLHLPVLVLAAVPLLLALRFGGYHVRHAGWVVLGLAAWACVQAARGRLSAPRSVAGVATFAMLGLVAWTTASIWWADVSRHDAWVEAVRAVGYGAMFVLGGSLLANARSFARFATLTGVGIALLGVATAVRLLLGDSPLQAFVAGRLDWPVGYAPGLAGLYLFGMLLLIGVSCAAERRWVSTRATRDHAAASAALGAAAACAALALLAQSRGTLPALLVGAVVALVATPDRIAWLLRATAIGAGLLAMRERLGDPFQAAFALRQAPFTEGSDEAALLAAAERSAHDAAGAVLALLVVVAVVGAAIVPASRWLRARVDALEARTGTRLAVPVTALVVAAVVALLVTTAGRDRSPTSWLADQWHGCVDPPERVNDPGSATSYFSNTGTGRCDYYRVALDNFRGAPLLGLGAGNFRGAYVLARRTAEEPSVAHSLPLQLLGELGLVGGLLGATVLGSVGWAAWRFARSGPGRDPAFAGAIGALGYWTAHASIDWLWQLPSVTLPAMALAGGLVACVSPAQRRVDTRVAGPIAAGVLLACAGLVLPVTMADRALRQARDPELRRDDPEAALAAARDAQDLDPSWAAPAITEAALLAAAGKREEAANAARRATELEPRNWRVQYEASGLIGLDDTQEGLRAFQEARRLNPRLPATVKDPEPAAAPDADALQPDT